MPILIKEVILLMCALATSVTLVHAAPPTNRSNAPDFAKQIRAAVIAKDVPRAQTIAKELIEVTQRAQSRDAVERLTKGVSDLLRFLQESGDTKNVKLLAETMLKARAPYVNVAGVFDADLINAVGEASFENGDLQTARENFKRSLALREKFLGKNHPLVSDSINNLAVVEQNLGDYKAARKQFELSLKIRELTLPRNHRDLTESINNLAVLNLLTGNYAVSEKQFKRSMENRRINPGPESIEFAESANNLAELYREVGDTGRALPLHQRALDIRRQRLGDAHLQVANSLNNLAILHFAQGDYSAAENEYRQAIDIYSKTLGNKHANVASMKNNLGLLLLRTGKLDDAQTMLAAALTVFRDLLGDFHPRTSRSIDNLAKVHLARNDLPSAERLLAEALAIVESAGDTDGKWRVLDTARQLEAARGNRPAAIVFGKRAVNTLQALRIKVRSLDKVLQQSFLKDKGEVYRALFELLVAEGRLAEAQQVLVMMKEDEYFDFIQRGEQSDPRRATAALSPSETAGITRYEEVGAEIGRLASERVILRRKEKPSSSDMARLAEMDSEMRNAKGRFEAALGEIHQYFARASSERAMEIGRMNLSELKAIQGTLEQLGEGTVTLHYVLLNEKVRILLTTPYTQVARESRIPLQVLNQNIQSFREAIQDSDRDPQPFAARLYQLLIAPVEKDLELSGAKTIMLSLDGALRYVPFAALHDGERYLIEKYRLAVFAEAARDKIKDKTAAAWKVAGLGMTQAVAGFSPLPSVADELNAIIKTGKSPRGVVPGRISIDNAFSRNALRSALNEGYPVLHIASHFVFKPGTELESFLLMGDKSRLSLKEIKEDDYDFRNVEMIALSACETAVGGGADNFGREIEGFAALVQKQGARSVMATLWEVADESTAELMVAFYTNRSVGRFSKAEALRQAQITFLRGEASTDHSTSASQRAAVSKKTRGNSKVKTLGYAHPFFWAPFILTGNWL